MAVCDARGRDCIEENSSKTFHCNTTCAGIYADVQWVGILSEEEFKDEKADDRIETDLEGMIDDEMRKMIFVLKNKMKLMEIEMKNMQNDVKDVVKIATGERNEELDKEKYKMLISEYRKFKSKNVKHFKFNSAAAKSTVGRSLLLFCFA